MNALSLTRAQARSIKATALLSLCFLPCGCRIGPRYVAPVMPPPPAYKEITPQAYQGAQPSTWQPASPQDAMLKGKWWEVFHEPELNQLEDQLDINNQNIALYFQDFMAARALVREARASYYPTLITAPTYGRSRSPSTLHGVTSSSIGGSSTGANSISSGSTSTILSLPFDVSWEPDLWGRIRNTVRLYRYAAQVSAADLENERLTEQADLAEYYFQLRGQDALQDLYNHTIEAYTQALGLTRVLVETGIDSPESVSQAEVTLNNAQAIGAGIATNRGIYEHAIATLIGQPASSFSLPVRSLTTAVPSIPVGIPSVLLQRRPDIAAAERSMAEANALIGVEKAAYYPTLSLNGSGGLESSSITSLFSAPAFFWSAGGSASQFVFDGGLRRATVAQYTAQYNADVAAYRQSVLTAFQQVEDGLSTLRVTSGQITRQRVAVSAAQQYVEIATARYQTGLDPYLNVVSAQTTLLTDKQTEVNLRIAEMTAAVQLIQALGGGWDVAQLPTPAQVTNNNAANALATRP